MISITTAQLNAWMSLFLWPLVRILALIASAPLFSSQSVPKRTQIGLAVLITLIVAPTLPAPPQVSLASGAGLFILLQQIVIGLAMGFAMRLVFVAIDAAGELIGLQMGLGFATFFDPQSAGQTAIIGTFFNLLATLAFLAIDGHLLLLSVLVESFKTFPIGGPSIAAAGWKALADWGSMIFLWGLTLALPVIAALLITNLALGILTKAASQLNIFAVGFPVTLSIGMLTMVLTLPYMAPAFERLFSEGFQATGLIAKQAIPAPP